MSNKIMLMLYGSMGCGKSYFAEKFQQYLEDSYLKNEYDILVESSSKFLKKEFDNGTLFKDPIIKNSPMIKDYKALYDTVPDQELRSLYKRILLQTCGTEIPILNGTETAWAEMLCEDIENRYSEDDDKVIVINDGCRFLHEIDTFARYGFKVLTVYMKVDDSVVLEAYHERYGDSKIDWRPSGI